MVHPHTYTTLLLTFAVTLAAASMGLAETKTIVSEADYLMGDGETPAAAEAMVLQKAKQRALEEAGTYVRSYTEVRNLDLTVDEIKTIAAGIMQTEVLDQKRVMDGSGLRFFIKIKSVVTTDNVDALAKQKQLSALAQENRRLQDHLNSLAATLDSLKRQIPPTTREAEREVVLDQIRDLEKRFRDVRASQTALYKRLISGQDLANQVDEAFRKEQERKDAADRRLAQQREALSDFLRILEEDGHSLLISPPQTDVSLNQPDTVMLRFDVSVDASMSLRNALKALNAAYRGEEDGPAAWRVQQVLDRLELVLKVILADGSEYVETQRPVHNFKNVEHYDIRQWINDRPRHTSVSIAVPRTVVSHINSIEGTIHVAGKPGNTQVQ
jgi:hypothetical protein